MKKILLLCLLIPTLLLGQETKKTEKRQKADGWSGATKMSKTPIYKGKISGKIKSFKNKTPLEFATISLTETKKNKLIEGTISDKKGRFYFNDVNIGEYKITINFIGFQEETILIKTSKNQPDIKLNNITLNQDSELLSEVTIEEEKAIYESRIDKIVYNAENDLNDSENDATDVLRKAPLLSVDLDGNVSLRGSRNIKFLVNGKASSFFSSDISSALQMIPAEQIKAVEVITSPGAKYEGEGDAGIVNIITKKKIIDGYNASLSSMIGSKMMRSGLNLNFGKGRFGLSVRGGFYGSFPPSIARKFGLERIGTNTYERISWDTIVNGIRVNPDTLKQNGDNESYYQGYRGSINTFYDLNAYNSFNSSFRFGGRTKPLENNNFVEYSGTDTSYTSQYSLSKTDRTLNLEWTTDFTKKFPNHEDRELVLAFQIGGDINDGDTDIDEAGYELFNQNDEKVIEETFQIDYTHPFGNKNKEKITQNIEQEPKGRGMGRGKRGGMEKSKGNTNKLEIGAKIINRDREIVYSEQRNDINNISFNSLGSIYTTAEEFNYNQLVAASYIATEFILPYDLGLKTGVRYEYTASSGDWKTNSTPAFEKNYSNILPNIILSKSFSPMRSIKLSYNQRIRRPSVRNINTNEDKADSRNITIGNPNLEPTVTEQYEFSINSFGKILQASTKIYYKHSFNMIQTFIEEIDGDVSISRYKNIGESKQIGGNLFGSIKLKKLNLRGSCDIYNYSGKDQSLGYEDWTQPVLLYSYSIGGSYDLGKNWKAEGYGFFQSPSQTIQGTSTSFSMMSFGIKKTFKNKRGSIGLRIIEPFNENKEFISDLEGDNFTQYSKRTIPFRSFGISFKYTFGKLNFKDGSKKTNIKNDDIQEESSGEY